MKTLMIRYKTSPDGAGENEALIHAVFDELRLKQPGGLRYATFRLADGVTFVHVVSMENDEANVIPRLPAFQAFQKELKQRCEELPVTTEWLPVDAYVAAAGGAL